MAALPRFKPTDDFEVPDEGTHRVRFVEYGEPKKSNLGEGHYMRLTFQVEDPESEFHGLKFGDNFGWPKNLSPKVKLYKFVRAAYGDEIDENTNIDLDQLVGKALMVTIEHVEKPNPEDPRNPNVFCKVIAASAIKKKAPKKPAPPPPPDDDEEEDDPFTA